MDEQVKTNGAKKWWGWGVVVVVILIIIGFARTPENKGTVRIGVPLALSGSAAGFGESIKMGYDLAVEEINNKSDLKLELLYDDTLSQLETAVSAVNKLIDIDKVDILLGPLRSSEVLAVAPIAEKNKVLLFNPIASTGDITNAGDYIFRNRETGAVHGIAMARYFLDRNIKNVAVLYAKSANSQTYSEAFEKYFSENGGKIVSSEGYEEKLNDYRTIIHKSLVNDPEAFYVSATLGPDAGLALRQIREAGFKGFVGGSAGIESDEFLKTAGAWAESMIYTGPSYSTDSEEISGFVSSFESKYGKKPDAFSANAYDAINLIVLGLKKCGDNPTCIKDYLYSVKDYPGVGGLTTFDSNGDVIKPVILKTIRDGQFVKLEE